MGTHLILRYHRYLPFMGSLSPGFASVLNKSLIYKVSHRRADAHFSTRTNNRYVTFRILIKIRNTTHVLLLMTLFLYTDWELDVGLKNEKWERIVKSYLPWSYWRSSSPLRVRQTFTFKNTFDRCFYSLLKNCRSFRCSKFHIGISKDAFLNAV